MTEHSTSHSHDHQVVTAMIIMIMSTLVTGIRLG